jgi:hypothetical protein
MLPHESLSRLSVFVCGARCLASSHAFDVISRGSGQRSIDVLIQSVAARFCVRLAVGLSR